MGTVRNWVGWAGNGVLRGTVWCGEQAGYAASSAVKGTGRLVVKGSSFVVKVGANAVADSTKWALQRVFDRALDATAWVAKAAVVTSIGVTGLAAAGAYFNPEGTLKIVDLVASTLGAAPRGAADIKEAGDVVIISAQYMGELMGKAFVFAINLGAKTVGHTVGAIGKYVVVPLFQGAYGVASDALVKEWAAVGNAFRTCFGWC